MSGRAALGYSLALFLMGAGWGITLPLTKIAVSTGYGHFGLIFWQLVIGVAFLGTVAVLTRRPVPLTRKTLRVYVVIAILGTVVPNTASYQAAVHLPSGVLSILLSMVPMLAFPIALGLGLDRFRWRRLCGLLFGLLGVSLIILPQAQMEGAIPVFWVLIGVFSVLCYATEGNVVARWGTAGLDPVQVMLGASLIGIVMVAPLMLATGQFIDPRPPYDLAILALIASSVFHILVYTAYVWMVGRAGPVFAVQVSYLVTGFGMIWARIILGEAYAPTIWLALAAMFVGMYLVQPRREAALAGDAAIGDNGDQISGPAR